MSTETINIQALENIKTRRSVRTYMSEPLTDSQINVLTEAGQYAPTGHGSQSTAFLAVQNIRLIQTLSRLNADVLRQANPGYMGDPFYGAPFVMCVFAKSEPNAVKNGSAAIENILLAAHALNLGSCWINRAKEVFESEEGKTIMRKYQIPEDYEGIGFVIAGKTARENPLAPARTSIVRVVK